MKKIFVLDTNVMLQDPMSIYSFDDNDVIIPSTVLDEVDGKKKLMDEVGRNARLFANIIDQLRFVGPLHTRIPLGTAGGHLKVELAHEDRLGFGFKMDIKDNKILAVAHYLTKEEEKKGKDGKQVILVSKDALMRVKADAIGIKADDYLNDRVVELDHLYSGYKEFTVTKELIDQFYRHNEIPLRDLTTKELYPHQFILLKDGNSASAIGIVDGECRRVSKLLVPCDQAWGIQPRNAQQKMAFELLLREDIPLVTMSGKAGTGKTLLALAAGLMKTEDENKFKKLICARSIVPMGKDIGYLPGEKEEKLRPWMQPIYDNLEYLFNTKKAGELDRILSGLGSIQVEALTYVRGRSIPEQFIIIDEAQNLTKHEVKTIVTRIGEKSKLVLMGDPAQIDHPYLDGHSNGLTYLIEKMKNQTIAGHITLEKGERSDLAQLAADIL